MNTQKTKLFEHIVFFSLILLGIAYILQESFLETTLNDYYWHYKVGEWIIDNKQIPTAGIFSWYAQQEGLYWFSHEWLSAVLIYLLSFGNPITSIIITKILCLAFFIICLVITRKYIKTAWITYLVYSFFFVTILESFFYPRPHVFSYFLLFVELCLLYGFINTQNKKLLIGLPVIAILWANIHGGSSNLIYILPIFFLITTLFDFSFGKMEFKKIERKSSLWLFVTTIISTLSLMVNPHTYKLLWYPFENMQNEFMLNVIVEWAAPDIKDFTSLYYVLPVVFVGIFLIITTKKIKGYDLLSFLFFAYMYFRSERFIALFLIASIFMLYEYAPITKVDILETANIRIKAIIYTFIIAFSFCYLALSILTVVEEKNIKVQDSLISEDALVVIRTLEEKGLYNHYNIGGELIYNDVEVFIDGRADMYTGHNFEDFYNLSRYVLNEKSETLVEDLIEEYELTSFVCLKLETINIYFQNNTDKYKLIYEDEHLNIYVDVEYYSEKFPQVIFNTSYLLQNGVSPIDSFVFREIQRAF